MQGRTQCAPSLFSYLQTRRRKPSSFASAHPARIASIVGRADVRQYGFASAHPARIVSYKRLDCLLHLILCLSTSRTDCIQEGGIGGSIRNLFASAHPARIASAEHPEPRYPTCFASAHPARIASPLAHRALARRSLCLSTSRTDCISTDTVPSTGAMALPQHIPHGLHRLLYPDKFEEFKLCLSTSRTDCIERNHRRQHRALSLPQHIPHGLHQQKRADTML